MSDDWCTIESDPGVFTELLGTLGCGAVELAELWSLDEGSLQQLQQQTGQVYGLVFLFKWMGQQQADHAAAKKPLTEQEIPENLFFAHQVTTNACATQAILSVVLNSGLDADATGKTLAEFKSFTADFPPSLKGEAVAASQEIKTAHNAYSRRDAFLQQDKVHVASEDDEAFHFVAYVPVDNKVYELDGLQKGPMVVGELNADAGTEDAAADGEGGNSSDWLTMAAAAIQERMVAGGDHVKFNLMAVIQDKRILLQDKLATITDQGSLEYAETVGLLAAEDQKREQYKVENQRRQHNYVPLCMQLLQELARAGSLPTLVSEAKERQAEKRKQRQQSS